MRPWMKRLLCLHRWTGWLVVEEYHGDDVEMFNAKFRSERACVECGKVQSRHRW